MKSAEEYFNKNYGKYHLDRCIELNDKQSIYALMEEFADSEVKNLTIPFVSQKRELLIDFFKFFRKQKLGTYKAKTLNEDLVDNYIKSINCG